MGRWTLAKFARQELAVGDFEIAGLVDTRGSSHVVTGSAAGGTAGPTGTRTFFGAVGVGPDGTPRQTVPEAAKARGMATGLTSRSRAAILGRPLYISPPPFHIEQIFYYLLVI